MANPAEPSPHTFPLRALRLNLVAVENLMKCLSGLCCGNVACNRADRISLVSPSHRATLAAIGLRSRRPRSPLTARPGNSEQVELAMQFPLRHRTFPFFLVLQEKLQRRLLSCSAFLLASAPQTPCRPTDSKTSITRWGIISYVTEQYSDAPSIRRVFHRDVKPM